MSQVLSVDAQHFIIVPQFCHLWQPVLQEAGPGWRLLAPQTYGWVWCPAAQSAHALPGWPGWWCCGSGWDWVIVMGEKLRVEQDAQAGAWSPSPAWQLAWRGNMTAEAQRWHDCGGWMPNWHHWPAKIILLVWCRNAMKVVTDLFFHILSYSQVKQITKYRKNNVRQGLGSVHHLLFVWRQL